MTADEWRELNHHKITVGGLLVKQKMEKIYRTTLFGAVLNSKIHKFRALNHTQLYGKQSGPAFEHIRLSVESLEGCGRGV